ncbi:MAG: hypothetical protein IJH65_03170 [Methanobrevibacter sp.]|nr:hypothetical protein [Methanobrevibacter sp.]
MAQTATSDNNDYEILFSGSADNTTKTEGARKNSNLLFNPSTGKLQVGGSIGSGTLSDTAERFVGVYSNSGSILLDSVGNSNGDGTRGI